jgi:hypothetical protein
MDIDSVADELYALPPEDFTAARAAREKEAKAAGDKELLAAIHQLGKPNLVAWLANQLVRERADEIGPLLELGAALREATAALSGPDLRELSRQQHQVVYALVQEAKALARAAGRKVSPDTERGLEDSLHAALADEGAAELLLAGRLTTSLQRIGFPGGPDANPLPAKPAPKAGTSTSASRKAASVTTEAELAQRRRAAELERAKQAESIARTSAKRSKALVEQAGTALERAEKELTSAADRVEEVRAELEKVTKAHDKSEASRNAARNRVEETERAAVDAEAELERATSRRRDLEDGAG